ncbi:Formate hydrogenlyase subunit 4 [Desulfurella amilsii]|uniref:Formate hydrogenlyase subunit 4 n=1 Tax=Desulfurella amilsii TaxID=1562698 RepID=A0A1X4XVA7_9BACT|nr:NADH-quinone oxidoreductase subunit H [Desulfurella amilsii]OSS41462.1 Formate hydrogenlyase subunit 4 [Desulfurella amilsii]
MLVFLSILQLLYVIALSPLAIGILNFFDERLSSRGGPSIFQEYYNIFKYFKKQSIYPSTASDFFSYVPYITFAMYLFLTLVLPIITAFPLTFGPVVDFVGGGLVFGAASTLIKLASLDSKNNYSILGASRASSIGIFTEPIILLIFIMFGVISGTNNPYVINNILQTSTSWFFSLVHLFIAIAFFFVLIIETGQLPIESHTPNELGSIDSLMSQEYSGRELALVKWGSYAKSFILMNVFLNVYTFPFFVPMKLNLLSVFIYMFINFFKITVLLAVFAIINNIVSKYRLFKIFDYIAIAFSFALMAMLVFYIVNGG